LKILDWYIAKKFLGTFFFILCLLMLLAVVFDAAEKTDDIVKSEATLSQIFFNYYLHFIIYYANLFSSLIIFLSVIFFTSKLARQNEIVAILSSGVSYPRMLRPYFIVATLLALTSILSNHFLLPKSNKIRLEFEDKYLLSKRSASNIYSEINPGEIIYFHNNYYGYLSDFYLERWEDNHLKTIIYAQKAEYDSLLNKWTLSYFMIRYLYDDKDKVIRGDKLDTTLNFKPQDFTMRHEVASSMNYKELNEFIERQRLKGDTQVPFYEIEKHQRTAFPMAVYILTFIGVAIAGRKSRGGLGLHLLMGILIALLYIFSMKMTTVAATNAGLQAEYAVWIPNLIFIFVAIPIYLNAQK
jgi:lipopolysaccharide export system permease protein